MEWQKEVKEEGWYWICQFYMLYPTKNKYETIIFSEPEISIDYVCKNDNGFFLPANAYDEYSEDEYLTEENKDKYCFVGPIEKPELPNYRVKKVKGKLIKIENEDKI